MNSYPRKELLMNIPKEIQNRIGMFNCEHRPQMKMVLKEMIRVYFPKKTNEYWIAQHKIMIQNSQIVIKYALQCCYCDGPKDLYVLNSVYCSNHCCHQHSKEMYEELFEDNDYDYDSDY